MVAQDIRQDEQPNKSQPFPPKIIQYATSYYIISKDSVHKSRSGRKYVRYVSVDLVDMFRIHLNNRLLRLCHIIHFYSPILTQSYPIPKKKRLVRNIIGVAIGLSKPEKDDLRGNRPPCGALQKISLLHRKTILRTVVCEYSN